jgi:hypothetical protein
VALWDEQIDGSIFMEFGGARNDGRPLVAINAVMAAEASSAPNSPMTKKGILAG